MSKLGPWSIFASLCDPGNLLWETGAMARIQNLNLVLKLMELHHTVWMSMSGRKNHATQFQLFHNVVLLWMCWLQLGPNGAPVQWLPILMNSVVHVFMYLCMYQVYRGGRAPFFSRLPVFQFVQGMLTSVAILAVMTSRVLHDFVDPVIFERCGGSWKAIGLTASLGMCYPLGYLVLHKPDTDSWIAERGLGLFFHVGRDLRQKQE